MGADAQATLRINTVLDSGDAISNINKIQKHLESLKLPKGLTDKAQTGFDELKKSVREYQELLDKPSKSGADLRKIDQLGAGIKKQFADVEKYIRNIDFGDIDIGNLAGPELDKIRTKIEQVTQAGKEMTRTAFQKNGLTDELGKATGDLKKLQDITEKMTARTGKGLFQKLIGDIKEGNIEALEGHLKEIDKYMNQQSKASKKFKEYEEAEPILKAIRNTLDNMEPSFEEISAASREAGQKVEQLTRELEQAAQSRVDEIGKDMRGVADATNEAAHATNTWEQSMNRAAHHQTEMQEQVRNLQQQVKNYFGLDEVFRKIGDLAREAMSTVKELDAAMTETAVVTNFDVSDMWKMLPTYTKNANALGSTIADVYNAATLYYQQGLTTTQSMALANETLKMARIGGIEAAEATDMMTAALRGFNMEINQTSAQRINDVYSKLAAITAADTREIGSAMERTASIASSANMDFETTAAFLSQMIETTREAPENLGTAMKTIIARFQELKVDPNTLVDSEGQALDFNRVDKALKSIGVSLVDENNQFRDLDDVFLEIASRWDGLSQAQQRYIATMAAGSRQQSRFIAMMQDYDRTLELVDAAYTAEGAGQAQFEKTLESMDSKLNRLKNAWDQFVMGLMNADFLKVGVDTATKFLDVIEKVISGISKIGIVDPFQGIIKSALTATTVFGGFIAMSKLLTSGIAKISEIALGEEIIKDSTGLGGMMWRKNNTPQKQAEKEERRKRLEDLKEATKKEAEIRDRAFYGGSVSNGEGYFSNLKAGSKAQKEIKDYQKQLFKAGQKGKLNFNDFYSGFSGLSSSGRAMLAPEIMKTFQDAINSANLDEAGKKAAQDLLNGAKSGLLSGDLEAFDKVNKGLQEKGVQIDGEQFISNTAPISMQFEKIGSGAIKAGQAIQMFGANLQGTPLEPFGNALMIVGQGLENIGMLMGNGLTAIKKWGSSMVAAGASTTLAGASASTATKFFAGLGATIWKTLVPLLPYIAAIAAAAVVIGALAYAATKSSRDLKRQGDAAAQAGQDLDTCKQALEALNNDLAELSNNDDALDNLTKGTTEWNNQLAEANSHIIEMMQNYKALNEIDQATGEYKYVKTDETGRMSITKEGQKALQEEYQSAVNIATANNAVQGALYNNLKDLNSEQKRRNDAIIAQADTYGIGAGTDEYRQAILQNQNIQKQNEAREANAWKTGVHAAINDLNLPNQSTVENILASQKDNLLATNKLDMITLGQRKDLENEYADLMGYVRKGKNTYQDAQGNELTIDLSVVKEQLPELRTLADMESRAGGTSKALDSLDRSFTSFTRQQEESGLSPSLLSDIMSDSAEISADEIAKIMSGGEDSILNSFIKSLEGSTDERQWRQFELLAGLEEGAITNVNQFNKALDDYQSALEEHANGLMEAQNQNISATVGLLQTAGRRNINQWVNPENGTFQRGSGAKTVAKGGVAQKELTAFTYEEMSKIATIGDQIGDQLGGDAAKQFAKAMTNSLHKDKNIEKGYGYVGKSARELIEKELVGVDFSNSLQVISAFNNLTNTFGVSGAKGAREYGTAVKESFDYAKQSALALQQVITSDDLAESLKDIKLDDTNGQYTAQVIKEAAESSQSLASYLEATNMSAGSFANILNKMGEAELDISDLTPGVVAFANAMDKVSQATGAALKSIQDFNAGDDLGSIDEFSQNAVKALDEMAENGEWGNTQMGGYLDNYFGTGAFEKLAANKGSYKKAYKQMRQELDKILIDEGDNAGQFDVGVGKDIIKGAKNTEDAIKKLRNEFKFLSEDAANQYLTAIINKSDKLGIRLRQGDNKNAYKDFRKTNKALGADYGKKGQQITSLTDIFKLRDLLGEKDAKAFWKNVAKDYGEVNAEQIKGLKKAYDSGDMEDYHKKLKEFTDGLGNLTEEQRKNLTEQQQKNLANLIGTDAYSSDEEIQNAVTKIFGNGKTPFQKTEDGLLDLEKAAEAFTLAAGGDQNVGYAALESYIRNGFEGQTFEYQGQKVTGKELVDEGIADKIASITDLQQWSAIGETMAESFANTLVMRTDENGLTTFMTRGQSQATDFSEGTDFEKNASLFKWLSEEGSGLLGQLMGASNELPQNENRQIVTDFINALSSQQIAVSETEMKTLWDKIISQTGGEGLAVNKGEDKDDAETISKKAETYVDLLSRAVTGVNTASQTDSLNTNLQDLINQMHSDELTNETQMNMLSTYLQQNATAFEQLDPGQQQEILSNIAEKFEGLDADTFASAINQGLGTAFEGKDFGLDENGKITAELDADAIQEQLNDLEANITGKMTIEVAGVGTGARGINNTHFGTMAQGSGGGYTIPGRPTLTGENGEELVWEPKRNEAYMVGTHGPQFANISKDAVVWNAAQTKRIKKNSGRAGLFGTGARGINRFGTMAEGNGRDLGAFTASIDGNLSLKPLEETPVIDVIGKISDTDAPKKGIPVKGRLIVTRKPDVSAIEPVHIKATADITNSNTSGLQNTEVTTTAEVEGTGDVNTLENKITNLKGKQVQVSANVSGAAAVGSLAAAINRLRDKDIDVTVHKKVQKDGEASGLGKYAPTGWNSFARGTKKPDPNFRGGLALTGEEGFEIAWSPKQGKSMILGTDGPQMVDLPKDIVIWSHDESKKIVKQRKGLPIGSFAKGKKEKVKPKFKYGVTKSEKSEATFFSWIGAVDQSQAKIDRWSKTIDRAKSAMERYAEDVGSSMTDLNNKIKQQSKLLNDQLKAAKSQETNARKALNKVNNSQKLINVSYNKNSKKNAKSGDLYIKEGSLVKKGSDGYLEIDEKAIRKKAKSKGTNAYQVNQIITELRSQAKSLADEYNGYLENSKETIDEIKEKQRELEKSIQDMFFNFEHSLTKIKEVQDRISTYDSFESKISSIQSLMDSQLKSGLLKGQDAVAQYTDLFNEHIDNLTHKVANQSFLLQQTAKNLEKDTRASDEYNKYITAKNKLKNTKEGTAAYTKTKAEADYWKEQYDKSVIGSKYVTVRRAKDTGALYVDINTDLLDKAQLKEEDYKAVEEYYDKVLQDIQDINSQTADINNSIASAYDELTNAYSEIDSYAKTIINGMQEDKQETIDSLKTLNDSIRDAFSDLIDSVRKELDKQRKAEQNAKTEKDITNQMNRLAMLRADTSGSNAAQIAQLEKEIAEATGSYEDSLEDQMLDRLQEDADKAAEQRERQISILEDELEYTKAIGQYVTEAENLIQSVIDGTNTEEMYNRLMNYYMLGSGGKDSMTKWGEQAARGEWESAVTKMTTFSDRIETLTATIKELQGTLEEINNTNPSINQSAQGVFDEAMRGKNATVVSSLKAVKAAGKTGNQAAGINYVDSKGNIQKVTANDLIAAGYTGAEIANSFSAEELLKSNAGTTAAGVAKKTTNSQGKETTGTITDSGKKIAFAEKGTVKYKDSSGKITNQLGLSKFYNRTDLLDKGNAEHKEYWQAIEYIIKNNSVGSKVPYLKTAIKNATNGGWRKTGIKLKGINVQGSVSKDGRIVYNDNDKVKFWDPSNGEIKAAKALDKLAKEELKKRVNNVYYGQEYKDAIKYYNKKHPKTPLKYATGGLADYTGPAWMDGTPSKPELVLNATDTKNFVALKDVLSEAAKRGMFNHEESNSTGDMTFDININVDKIDSDYDVEQVAKKVEKIIVTKAKHRNVTVTGRTR